MQFIKNCLFVCVCTRAYKFKTREVILAQDSILPASLSHMSFIETRILTLITYFSHNTDVVRTDTAVKQWQVIASSDEK